MVCMPVALNLDNIKPMSCTQLLKTVAYSKLLQHNTSPVSHNQDVFRFDWQELLLGIKACYYLSCLWQIGIDWCHLLSGTARSEYTLPCELRACCWRWLLSVYRGSVSCFMSVIDFHVPIKAWNHQNTVLFPCRCGHTHTYNVPAKLCFVHVAILACWHVQSEMISNTAHPSGD